ARRARSHRRRQHRRHARQRPGCSDRGGLAGRAEGNRGARPASGHRRGSHARLRCRRGANRESVSDTIRIETATSLDLADCRRLVLGSEPWITLGYGEADAEAIARSSAADNLIVALAGDRVVGFALSAPGVLLGEYLKLLAVEPERRAGGIGRRLMAELESRAFVRWPNVYLCVSDFNVGA